MSQEAAGPPGVFGRDHRDRAQQVAGTRREIAQIAERGRDDVERTGSTHGAGMAGRGRKPKGVKRPALGPSTPYRWITVSGEMLLDLALKRRLGDGADHGVVVLPGLEEEDAGVRRHLEPHR